MVAKPEAGLRAAARGVTSVTGADTTSLVALLEERHAVMRPLFGLTEDRLRAQQRASAPGPGGPTAPVGEGGMPDLSLFYWVAAEETRLQQLADALLAHDLVDAAYVKPPAEPPTVLDQSPRVGLNDMAPDAGDAPPSTPTFVDHQIPRNRTPTGVDALFAGTLPGGDGRGVHIIDCEWAWRFTHEDLLQNQGGLLERVGAPTTLVSSVASGGKYGFPHLLAIEAAREARQPTTSKNTPRGTDQQLGIHVTGSLLDTTGQPCGSIALVAPSNPNRQPKLFRLMDRPTAKIDLTEARAVK